MVFRNTEYSLYKNMLAIPWDPTVKQTCISPLILYLLTDLTVPYKNIQFSDEILDSFIRILGEIYRQMNISQFEIGGLFDNFFFSFSEVQKVSTKYSPP